MDLDRIQEILAQASELKPSEREALLAETCGEDTELRAEVERLLRSLDSAGSFLAAPVVRSPTEILPQGWDEPFALLGQTVGAYRLVDVLGWGGMGVVYLAERDDDSYRRQVAVKLILRNVGTGAAHQRFLGERQILAALEHPNIARLYDGGETEDKQPFLVMEHVEGVPLDVYCREQELGVDDRIRLFQEVCGAVAYAHRNLLVHRDLKPSNILVTAEGVPKLLDFGIAMSLADGDRRATLPGEQPMTPAYASPEQVRGHSITTASDVYSLGVLLYELLTSRRPYQLKEDNDLTLQNAICEQEPARPSSVLAGEQSKVLRHRLRGDLDVIVLKALRKEPEHRYASVEALSGDLGRFLDHLPVQAREGALTYRLRKFVRRNRFAVAAAAVVVAILVGFVIALARQTLVAIRQSQRAEKALATMIDAFKASDPEERALGHELTAREILDQGAGKVRRSLAGDPESQATLLAAMGEVYVSLGLFDEAETLLQEAYELRGQVGVDVGLSLYQLGELELARREYRAAVGYLRQAVDTLAADSVAAARSLRGLGLALVELQRPEGEPMLRDALAVLSGQFVRDDPEILRGLEGLGIAAVNRGDYAKAERMYREIVAARRAQGAGPSLGRSMADLAAVRRRQGAVDEADALHGEALPLLREALGGAENPYVAEALGRLAVVNLDLGDFGSAARALREVLAMRDSAARLTVAEALHNLGPVLANRGELVEAQAVTSEALALKRELYSEHHEVVASSLCSLGRIAHMASDLGAARAYLEECAAVLEALHPEGHPQVAFAWLALGQIAKAETGCETAEQWFRRALDIRIKHLGAEHVLTQRTAAALEGCQR